ncbi:MAG: hypothetical protein GOVbin3661_74 [Prokaryotic dsDNA virus sp.]|nr:MAG: hypothetical protein GOVbin3661_74 [Prokaryotic dsDNA virus sp.]|tara:strand:+ start:2415 stop:3227 length:813 start_codon:yes stop_codon:yes gene_type:complete
MKTLSKKEEKQLKGSLEELREATKEANQLAAREFLKSIKESPSARVRKETDTVKPTVDFNPDEKIIKKLEEEQDLVKRLFSKEKLEPSESRELLRAISNQRAGKKRLEELGEVEFVEKVGNFLNVAEGKVGIVAPSKLTVPEKDREKKRKNTGKHLFLEPIKGDHGDDFLLPELPIKEEPALEGPIKEEPKEEHEGEHEFEEPIFEGPIDGKIPVVEEKEKEEEPVAEAPAEEPIHVDEEGGKKEKPSEGLPEDIEEISSKKPGPEPGEE